MRLTCNALSIDMHEKEREYQALEMLHVIPENGFNFTFDKSVYSQYQRNQQEQQQQKYTHSQLDSLSLYRPHSISPCHASVEVRNNIQIFKAKEYFHCPNQLWGEQSNTINSICICATNFKQTILLLKSYFPLCDEINEGKWQIYRWNIVAWPSPGH